MIESLKRWNVLEPDMCRIKQGNNPIDFHCVIGKKLEVFTLKNGRILDGGIGGFQSVLQQTIEARGWEWVLSSELAESGQVRYYAALPHSEDHCYADTPVEALLEAYIAALDETSKTGIKSKSLAPVEEL